MNKYIVILMTCVCVIANFSMAETIEDILNNQIREEVRKSTANWHRLYDGATLPNGLTVTGAFTNSGDLTTSAGDITASAGDISATQTASGIVSVATFTAGENADAKLILDADDGDDNADTWTVESEATGNDLSVLNHTTEVLNLTSAGALSVISTFDADSVTVDASAGLDTQAAGSLLIGAATATSVEIADTAVATDIQGTLSVDEAAVFDTTLEITGLPIVTVTNAPGSSTMAINDLPAATTNALYFKIRLTGATNEYVIPAFKM